MSTVRMGLRLSKMEREIGRPDTERTIRLMSSIIQIGEVWGTGHNEVSYELDRNEVAALGAALTHWANEEKR